MDEILRTYFQELNATLAGLPQTRREQLVLEIRQHVADAVAEKAPASEAQVRELLERVGSPEAVAAAALEEEDLPVGGAAEEIPPSPRGRVGDKLLIGVVTLLLITALSVGLILTLV
ncbi:MAG TPA: hypothetical protein VHZ02_19615, partial [Acidimicrobiales bacterium]|nr:hypothetical protein [Acidimicrobiales bacterium]